MPTIRPRRRKAKENSVRDLLVILERDIEPKFGNRRKFLLKHDIHKQPNNKYHKILYNIILFLEKERGDHSNSMESMVRDYLTAIYKYYWRFKRTPAVNQLSPSTNNQIKFQEWVYEFERGEEEPYWTMEEDIYTGPVAFEDDFNIDADIAEV